MALCNGITKNIILREFQRFGPAKVPFFPCILFLEPLHSIYMINLIGNFLIDTLYFQKREVHTKISQANQSVAINRHIQTETGQAPPLFFFFLSLPSFRFSPHKAKKKLVFLRLFRAFPSLEGAQKTKKCFEIQKLFWRRYFMARLRHNETSQ